MAPFTNAGLYDMIFSEVMDMALIPGELYKCATETPDYINGMLFEADTLERFNAATLDFIGCRFLNATFNACEVDRIYFSDCAFEKCDLSGFHFREGTLRKVSFTNCRLSGASLDNMSLRDVGFYGCLMEYAGFVNCKMQDVRFVGCRMEHGLMHGCAQKGLTFSDCDMTGIEVVSTKLRDVDLSTCRIEGIRTTIDMLSGATLGLHQAPTALQLCGITLKV